MNIAIFAAGCFWGIEKKFDLTKGVTKVEVGYTGGKTQNPTYEQVCYEETGHAEAVRINFDEKIITYKELLNIFWSCHNPTTLNRLYNHVIGNNKIHKMLIIASARK